MLLPGKNGGDPRVDKTIYVPQPMVMGQRDPNIRPPTKDEVLQEQQSEIRQLRQELAKNQEALRTFGQMATCLAHQIFRGEVEMLPDKSGIVVTKELRDLLQKNNVQLTTAVNPTGDLLIRLRERAPFGAMEAR